MLFRSKGGDITDWMNLLLGCKYCNARKSANTTPENDDDFLWPDVNLSLIHICLSHTTSTGRRAWQAIWRMWAMRQRARPAYTKMCIRDSLLTHLSDLIPLKAAHLPLDNHFHMCMQLLYYSHQAIKNHHHYQELC